MKAILALALLAVMLAGCAGERIDSIETPYNQPNEQTATMGVTKASISTENRSMEFVSAVATLEYLAYPGWSKLVVRLYPYEIGPEELVNLTEDSLEDIRMRRSTYKDPVVGLDVINTTMYRNFGIIHFNVDEQFSVGQIDITIPGYACTVAHTQSDIDAALQEYSMDGEQLALKTAGSYVCKIPGEEWSFTWDIELSSPVFDLR